MSDILFDQVACCEVYSAEDLHQHTRPLWSSLCREVMEGASKEVEEAALSALIAVVSVLEAGLTTSASRAAAATLMQEAFAECESHLEAPEQRLMWPSTRLLVALVVAAPGPAAAITARVVPQLTRQFVRSDATELACQNTMSALAMVLEAAAKHSHMLLGQWVATFFRLLYLYSLDVKLAKMSPLTSPFRTHGIG
ncbi:MMS19 nucleotide excision repair [Chionoecetes opilio]|uniref:MMS19 nucleotide excision repair protein n=1 Tax=Chionoecetes opilio TaxID=41210 RepID=A0A8J4XND5_CHIOP|nr:MMS19 nucleotide excision repair [Chionoecetes opilio]